MPEFCAPALGNKPNLVTIDAEIPANANGVLYKLGGNSGGLTCFVENGILCYEYNLFIILRTKIRATEQTPRWQGEDRGRNGVRRAEAGWARSSHHEASTARSSRPSDRFRSARHCCSPRTTASTSELISGSPVSLDYRDKAPFKFNGAIGKVNVKYIPQPAKYPREPGVPTCNVPGALNVSALVAGLVSGASQRLRCTSPASTC